MTLKNNNLNIFLCFFPITPKIRASDKNGLQIRILHRKIYQLKEKKTLFFYMTLNDNNTKNHYINLKIILIYSFHTQ